MRRRWPWLGWAPAPWAPWSARRARLAVAGSGREASSACRWPRAASGTARPPAGTTSSPRCSPGAGSWGWRRRRLWGDAAVSAAGAGAGAARPGAGSLTFAVLQVADSHLQDVGLLQLGVGLVPCELLLQQQLQLLDAAVDAVAPHLLHHGLPQLRGQERQEGGRRGARGRRAAGRALTRFFSLGLSSSTATVLGAMPERREAVGERRAAGGQARLSGTDRPLYRRRRRAGAWGPGAAAVPTLGGQWGRGPHKGAGPLAHAKLPVNWRGHNGCSPRSRWAARHNVRAVGTRSPSLASRA